MLATNSVCRVELLGGLRLVQEGRVVTRFRTRRAAALLGLLASQINVSHPREVLVELLWPECDPMAGRRRLSVELSSLRRQLDMPGASGASIILADQASIRLNPDFVTTDVAEFEQLISQADATSGPLERVRDLTDAAAMCRGPFLHGQYADWVTAEQDRLAALHFQATQALTICLVEAGDYQKAIDVARVAVGVDPLREEAHCRLMELLEADGQTAAALKQYEKLEQVLRSELNALPSEATRELMMRLRSARRDAPTQPPTAIAPRPRNGAIPPQGATVTFLLMGMDYGLPSPGAEGEPASLFSAPHRDLLASRLAQFGGRETTLPAEAMACVFGRPSDAVNCAAEFLREAEDLTGTHETGGPRLKMALDVGEVQLAGSRYGGKAVDRAQGLLLAAHPGQTLCSEPLGSLIRDELPDGVELIDLGYHILPGSDQPDRVYMVRWGDGAREAEFPPLKAAYVFRSNIPRQFTRFFGRESERESLAQLLQSEETRLVTITGPGGSGKTRLAVEVAGELVDAFRGATWFVSLQELGDAKLIPGAVVDALGLRRAGQTPPLEQACEVLSGQPSLLVIDNFEHLVAEGATTVRTMLERVPTLRCLVTSRQRLSIEAETEFPLDALPTPDGGADLHSLLRCPSVQLFVDRAQASRPDFQVTERNAETIALLCDRLEGIPLALELAAARAQVLSPARMLEQVQSRFAFLVSRRRDTTERHRSLWAAMDWSHHFLSPELQHFFKALSVFRGGFTVKAATNVCREPQALAYIEELLECSMVVADTSHDLAADSRFKMLETLREYGSERLSDEEGIGLRDRHARYYLALAQEAEPQLYGPGQVYWLKRLGTEHDNLRAALSWFAQTDADPMDGLALSAALSRFWVTQGHVTEGRAWVSLFLSRTAEGEVSLPRARVLVAAGQLATAAGDVPGAPPLLKEALSIAEALSDPATMAAALASMGMIATWASDLDGADAAYAACLSAARQIDDKRTVAIALGGLSRVAASKGEGNRAHALAEERLAMERELGDPLEISEALHDVGVAGMIQTDYEAALPALEDCLRIRRDIQYPVGIAQALFDLGWTAMEAGDNTRARECFEECHGLCATLDFPLGSSFSLWGLARSAYHNGDLTTAGRLVGEAIDTVRAMDFRQGLGAFVWSASRIALGEGDVLRAKSQLAEALTCTQSVGDQRYQVSSVETLADILITHGRPELGMKLLSAARAHRDRLGTKVPQIDRPAYERTQHAACRALGEDAFQRACAEGAAMDWPAALRMAEDALEGDTSD